jgi:hypothetical protein
MEPTILYTEHGPRVVRECRPVAALVTLWPEPQADEFIVAADRVDWWYEEIVTKMVCAYAGFSLLSYYILPHRELPHD